MTSSSSSSSRKIILLDVDDVILMDAYSLELQEPPVNSRPVTGYINPNGGVQKAWVDETVLATLRALPPEVEIFWVSSWLAMDYDQIDRLAMSLGLQRVSIADLDGVEPGRWGMAGDFSDLGHWKTQMMRNIVRDNPDIPILWVDDHLSFGFVRQLHYLPLSILAPVRGRGLTPESAKRIARWCDDGQPFMQLGDDTERSLPLPH